MKIPEVRNELMNIMHDLDDLSTHVRINLNSLCDRIVTINTELKRRTSKKRTNEKFSNAITGDLAQCIKEFAQKYPNISQTVIARAFNVNAGRVSEVLHGKRK